LLAEEESKEIKIKLKFFRTYFKIFLRRTFFFLRNKINFKTYIILTSLGVGVFSGLAAVFLKQLVHFFQQEPQIFFKERNLDFILPFTPLIGIIISVVVINFFLGGKIYKSLSHIIYLIMRRGSDIPKRKMISHIITSGVTVGLGGSAGLEAPIVVTGAAIGSNTAKRLGFNYQTRTLLLACGSAAGISAIFNSPIAGVIFAFEVLLPEFSIPSLIPLLISSASAAVVSQFLYKGQLFFLITEGWNFNAIPFYIILGIFCGLISIYMIKTTFVTEKFLSRIKNSYVKAVLGGLLLSLLIFLVPSLYGEGYPTVINLLSENFTSIAPFSQPEFFNENVSLIVWAGIVIIAKVIATSLTIESGGNGGVIAPSLVTGAVAGFFLVQVTKLAGVELNTNNFIVVGMAGVLSGVLHSPLTGIFLIAEVTGGYLLFVPLMIVAAFSFFISRYFHPNSIYTTSLVERGINYRSEEEKYFLKNISVRELVERDFIPINPQMTLRELLAKIKLTKRSLFPVIDDKKKLIGIVSLNDIKEIMLDYEIYDVILVYELMDTNFKVVDIDIDMNKILELFKEKQLWNLAVTKNGEYFGFISKSNIFNTYLRVWSSLKSEEL
jgi:CIC family chloride channel protein